VGGPLSVVGDCNGPAIRTPLNPALLWNGAN